MLESGGIGNYAPQKKYFILSFQLASDCTKCRGAAQCALSNIPSSFMEVLNLCRRRCRWGNARNCVPSHCSASARQPEAPLTPLPLYFSLLYEKPKGGLPLKVNCFKWLSALLPSRCLSSWCLDICRPGHGFWWNPQFRPSASEADVLSRAPERCYRQEMWSGCFCF